MMDQTVWKAPLPAKCHENKQAYIHLLQGKVMVAISKYFILLVYHCQNVTL